MENPSFQSVGCRECLESNPLGFDITMAFQPIVDLSNNRLYGYEALVRGTDGQGAAWVLDQINDKNRYRFDQMCRVKAIELASRLGLPAMPSCRLHINFLPNAVYRPETCIRATLEATKSFGMPLDRLVFEVMESEKVRDEAHLKNIFATYRRQGFSTAIDDFGAGYAGLNLLAAFQPEIVKLDMFLTRGIDQDRARQAIVAGVLLTCSQLGIDVIAEGVETREEARTLRGMGIELMQGYLFGRPAFERLAAPKWPAL